jgi:toxin-antitoxin system PIN domain toxin
MTSNATENLWDVNVWLALLDPGNANHALAKAREKELVGGGVALCRVAQAGCLRLLTTEAVMGKKDVRSMKDAWMEMDRLAVLESVVFHEEPPTLEREWRKLTALDTPAPKIWTDAYLAAFAIAARLRFVTFDKGFRKYPGLHLLVVEPD